MWRKESNLFFYFREIPSPYNTVESGFCVSFPDQPLQFSTFSVRGHREQTGDRPKFTGNRPSFDWIMLLRANVVLGNWLLERELTYCNETQWTYKQRMSRCTVIGSLRLRAGLSRKSTVLSDSIVTDTTKSKDANQHVWKQLKAVEVCACPWRRF